MLKNKDMSEGEIAAIMQRIGEQAQAATPVLAIAPSAQKNRALNAMARTLCAATDDILKANAADMENGRANGLSPALLDRLQLSAERIEAIAAGIQAIAGLSDPVGETIASWSRPNGLEINRVRTPLGVIGVIYEARPNVTADAGALCLKSGNAVILRGGSDSAHSAGAIHQCLTEGLDQAGLPTSSIQMIPTTNRAAVGHLLSGLNGTVNVIVPRGGKSLVERVQNEARVPVFAHLEGLCHVYVDKSANLEMAREVVVNSKLRRTGICGSAETLLIDADCAPTHTAPILDALAAGGCEIRADEATRTLWPQARPASEEDWRTEYLAPVISVKQVEGVSGAIAHIATFSSHHTEAVIAEDADVVSQFFNQVDSAILLHNASTQFADGGEFGMGAEIGIATGKMHARGPVGVEQLTSFKYQVRGTGQTRP